MTKKNMQLAFSSMVAALSCAVMFFTGVFPFGTMALPALAGVFLISIVMECGRGWALGTYVTISVLSVLIAADREAVLFFILFFGYYPILKAVLESKFHRVIQVLLKFSIFNAAAILEFFLASKLLGIPQESFTIFGHSVPWLFLILGNIVFLIYDWAMSLLVVSYWNKIHPRLAKWFRH